MTQNDMPTSAVNIPLLRKAVEWAEAEAARPNGAWDQGVIAVEDNDTHCGTAFCIAGWALHESGWTLEQIKHGSRVLDEASRLLGVPVWSENIASAHLFDAENSIATVRRMAEEIAGERL